MLAFASHAPMSSPQSGNGPSSSSSGSSGVKHSARKSSFGFSSSSSSVTSSSAGSRPRTGVSFAYQVGPSRSQPAATWTSSASRQPQPIASSKSASTLSTQHQQQPSTAAATTAAAAAAPTTTSSASASSWTTSSVSSSSLPSTATPPIPSSPHLGPSNPPVSYDISAYSSSDLLKLLASLLTQIASTNDALTAAAASSPGVSSSSGHHPASPHPATTSQPAGSPTHHRHHTPIWQSLTTASRSALGTHSSTLTFHARNIPSITLEAYLLRILKYCPTTNHVFLSLLVYFDRMARMSGEIEGEYDDEEEGESSGASSSGEGMDQRHDMMEVDYDSQMPHTIQTQTMNTTRRRRRAGKGTSRSFVIDSYNIHRLVIAGVTVASKFFSDVFYTNGRYAKVGGLPLHELNQLELQFLLLNDFRLVISQDEMQRYAEQLIHFSRSQANPIVLKVDRGLAIPGSSRDDHEAKARALLEGHEPGRDRAPHVNGKLKSSAPVVAAPQPPFRAPVADSPAVSQSRSTAHFSTSHFQSPFAASSSSGSSSAGQYQPYHSALQSGSRVVHPQPQSQTPKMGASATSSSASSHHDHPQRQGEFSRAYESSDEESDSEHDDDDDDPRDDQSYNTETETETDAGETDASGSTTSDEPTVRPQRPYAGRRESMGSMMSSASEADSDAGEREEESGAVQEGCVEEDGSAERRDADGVQKTPEVSRRQERMVVDMDTA